MKDLIKRYLFPDQESGGEAAPATLDDIVDAAEPDRAGEAPAEKPAAKAEEKPAAQAWKSGDADRRKGYSGERRRGEDKDPELDIGVEEEVEQEGKKVKVPKKIKLSEMRETAKFLRDNKPLIQLGLGLGRQFKESPEWAKAFDLIQANMYKDGKYNGEYAAKTLSSLEGKETKIEGKIEDTSDDIKEMETELTELDPESPQYKILKRQINGLKTTRTQLAEALKANKALQDKIEGVSKTQNDQVSKAAKDKKDKEDADAVALFDKTFRGLTAKDAKDGFFMDDVDDTSYLEEGVRKHVGKLALEGKITNDEQFIAAIKDGCKAIADRIKTRNERIINGYLKTKQPAEPASRGKGLESGSQKKGAVDALDELIDSTTDEVMTKK